VRQLRDLGFTKDEIWKRARIGRLHRLYRGVYAVGHSRIGNASRPSARLGARDRRRRGRPGPTPETPHPPLLPAKKFDRQTPPEVNVTVGNHTVGFLRQAESVIVEVDGWRYHRGHQAFERDRARDLDLVRLGFRVLRFSYHQVTSRSEEGAAAVVLELVARSSS
jgi:very-short-patch-repair endonuclease